MISEDTSRAENLAGFWKRLNAFLVDFLLLYIILISIRRILIIMGIYFPVHVIFLVSYLSYSAFFTWRLGSTFGKRFLHLQVLSRDGKALRLSQVLVREVIGKTISAALFFIGFIMIAFSKKRALHDRIASSKVVVMSEKKTYKIQRLIFVLIWGGLLSSTVPRLWDAIRYCQITPYVGNTLQQRESWAAREVSQLTDDDVQEMMQWLQSHAESPGEYAIAIAASHDITIFGEPHGKKDYLEFLLSILPDLYDKAGVRCLAMETYKSKYNKKLYDLVTGENFDENLLLEIARGSAWESWGYKEYWDVCKKVWEINQQLPSNAKPLRLIGIDFEWDGPSIALVQNGPFIEKLRLVHVWDDFLLHILSPDGLFAKNIKKEISDTHERTIIWVGAAHSIKNTIPFFKKDGNYLLQYNRMGKILADDYQGSVAQIVLHNPTRSHKILELIERLMEEQGIAEAGFNIINSPFSSLTDKSSFYFKNREGFTFSDYYEGYIFLKPYSELIACEWWPGFISKEMFGRNKPFYEMLCGSTLRDAKEANEKIGQNGGILSN